MNAAGIDVSSRKSTVAVLRPFGEVVCLRSMLPTARKDWLLSLSS